MEKHQQKKSLLPILAVLVLPLASCSRPPISAQGARNSPTITAGGGAISTPTPDPNIPRNTGGGIIVPTPDPNHGKAAGELLPFEPAGDNLKASLLAHPPPDVWLVFPASVGQGQKQDNSMNGSTSTIKVELPPEAKKELSSYWRYLLSVRRDTSLIEMINARHDAERELQKIQLDPPDGRRPIARDEAEELVEFIRQSELDLMDQADKYR
jgi:hypothetical protein